MASSSGLIAKNTFALYFRQILFLLISLYTVRIVLNTLGETDYGIYNVVWGLVIFFNFFNSAFGSAVQRYLNYSLGQNNTEQARKIYSVSFIVFFVLSVILILLAETLGLWFFYAKLNIPEDRRAVALIVYQISIFTNLINIIRVPYHAVIVAYEKMPFFALMSIIEGALKLSAAFLLQLFQFDKLLMYTVFFFVISAVITVIHKIYCNRQFEIAHFYFSRDKKLIRELTGFSGWSSFSYIADTCNSHGLNMLLNIFFGVLLNASMGIALQVNAVVNQFSANFQTAFQPQIVKSYAAKDYEYFTSLVYITSKISFFLLLFITLPLCANINLIFQVWLKHIPQFSGQFTLVILCATLVDAISAPLLFSIQAQGNIKKYQLVVSALIFSSLPVSYLCLKLGFESVWILYIKLIFTFLTLAYRVFYLQKRVNISALSFFYEVMRPILLISVISVPLVFYIRSLFEEVAGFFVSCSASVCITASLVYLVGLNKKEKAIVKKYLRGFFQRKSPLRKPAEEVESREGDSVL